MWSALRKLCVTVPTLAAMACTDCVHPTMANEQGVVRVAAAADLRFTMGEIVEAFRQERPAVDVLVTYGSSGNFYAQLSNHAPFDIFFSADVDYPRRLIRQGLAVADHLGKLRVQRVRHPARIDRDHDDEQRERQQHVDGL